MKSKTINPPLTATYPRSDVEEVLARLDAIAGLLDRLCRAVEGNHPPQRPDLGALLAAIHARVGDRVFVAPELVEFALVADAEELRDAIVRAVGSLNPRRLGKKFAEVEAEDLAGFRLRRVGMDRAGTLWQVRKSPEPSPPSSVSARGIA